MRMSLVPNLLAVNVGRVRQGGWDSYSGIRNANRKACRWVALLQPGVPALRITAPGGDVSFAKAIGILCHTRL